MTPAKPNANLTISLWETQESEGQFKDTPGGDSWPNLRHETVYRVRNLVSP